MGPHGSILTGRIADRKTETGDRPVIRRTA